MTVNDLLNRLQEAADNGHGDSKVLLAMQPSWPLQFNVAGVVTPEEHEDYDEESSEHDAVYLVEGGHPYNMSPYAPRWVFENV